MIESNSAWSSENEVSISTATSGMRERISRQASTPVPSGRRTSMTTTSGSNVRARETASATVPASATTSRSSLASSRARRPPRTTS